MKYTRLNNAFLTVIVLVASTAIANSAQEGRLAPGAAAHAASELAELLRDHYCLLYTSPSPRDA